MLLFPLLFLCALARRVWNVWGEEMKGVVGGCKVMQEGGVECAAAGELMGRREIRGVFHDTLGPMDIKK